MTPWDVCYNSGLPQDKCECVDCFPWIHRFKFICTDAKDIDEVIEILEGQVAFFRELREKGYRITEPGNDYMLIIPPQRDGFYWARCKKCGKKYEEEDGVSKRLCPACKEGR